MFLDFSIVSSGNFSLIMSCWSEENVPDNNILTSRCNTTRDCLSAICPSKLSKRELEELYFSLVDNNLELKRRVNTQDEQLRQLSTKLQRMTATQRTYAGPGSQCEKPCCGGYKVVVEEQKHVIQEIQAANEKLTEHIKKLNMQLDSTKQFLKRPPSAPKKPGPRPGSAKNSTAAQTRPVAILPKSVASKPMVSGKAPSLSKPNSPRTPPRSQHPSTPDKRPASPGNIVPGSTFKSTVEWKRRQEAKESNGFGGPAASARHSSTSALISKKTGPDFSNLVNLTCECFKNNMIQENICNENKCHSLMEELKKQITFLQEELTKTHEEYSLRITRLEREVAEVSTERAIRDQILEQRDKDAREYAAKLRAEQNTSGDLALQLSMERSKVAELETQLKAASLSNEVAKTIEQHLTNPMTMKSDAATSVEAAKINATSFEAAKTDANRFKAAKIGSASFEAAKIGATSFEAANTNANTATDFKVDACECGKDEKVICTCRKEAKDYEQKSKTAEFERPMKQQETFEKPLPQIPVSPQITGQVQHAQNRKKSVETVESLNRRKSVDKPSSMPCERKTETNERSSKPCGQMHESTDTNENRRKSIETVERTNPMPCERKPVETIVRSSKPYAQITQEYAETNERQNRGQCCQISERNEDGGQVCLMPERNDEQNSGQICLISSKTAPKSYHVTEKPEPVTKNPDSVTQKPDPVTQKPDSVTREPDLVTKKPDSVPTTQFKDPTDLDSSDVTDATAKDDDRPVASNVCSYTEQLFQNKLADQDSGYTDPYKTLGSEEDKDNSKMKQDLMKRIKELQAQLVNLKESASSRTQNTLPSDSPIQETSHSEETYNIDLTGEEYPPRIASGDSGKKRKGEKQDTKELQLRDRSKDLNEANRRWVSYDLHTPYKDSYDDNMFKFDSQQSSDDKDSDRDKKGFSTTSYESTKYQIPGPIPSCNPNERCNIKPPQQIPRRTSKSEGNKREDKIKSLENPVEIEKHSGNSSSDKSDNDQIFPDRKDSIKVAIQRSLSKLGNMGGTNSPSFEHRESYQMGVSIGKIVTKEDDRSAGGDSSQLVQLKDSLQKLKFKQNHSDSEHSTNEDEKRSTRRQSITSSVSSKFPDEVSLASEPFRLVEELPTTSKASDFGYKSANAVTSTPVSMSCGNQTSDFKMEVCDDGTGEQLELCENYAHICRCPRTVKRDVAVFRSCSGTLCFKTTSIPGTLFRKCQCIGDKINDTQIAKPITMSPVSTGHAFPRRSSIGPHEFFSSRRNSQATEFINRGDSPEQLSRSSLSQRISQSIEIEPQIEKIERRDSKMEPRERRSSKFEPQEHRDLNVEPQNQSAENLHRAKNKLSGQSIPISHALNSSSEGTHPELLSDLSELDEEMRRLSPRRRRSMQRTEQRDRETSPIRRESPTKDAPVQFCLVSPTPTMLKPQKYLIGGLEVVRCSRGTSPENTDREISSYTDLPSERDSRWVPRSPGEDKATTTTSYTDSSTMPTAVHNDYNTYSEGELPQDRATRLMSFAGHPTRDTGSDGEQNLRVSSSQKMEQALQAIGEELALCRQLLLQTQRSSQPMVPSQEACPSPSIALHKAEPKTHIGDTFTPRCMFTLHIGTIVLSDEAVMASRDMSLTMTWQFYDQNVAMVRTRAGRVMHFDFSTEYDVKLTDEFLDYLKYEEMQIKICEISKQDEPFATCSLPLRDALLHTNRRADISLALCSGPLMLQSRDRNSSDALDTGDEVGVLDLWCMLRAEPRLLPRINKAIAKVGGSNGSNAVRPSTVGVIMAQINEDDQDTDNPSTDLDLISLPNKSPFFDDSKGQDRYPRKQSITNAGTAPKFYRDSRVTGRVVYNPQAIPDDDVESVSPSNPDRTNPSTSSRVDLTLNPDKTQVAFDDKRASGYDRRVSAGLSSGFLINEVPTNIRSTNEMKRALEKGIKETYVTARVQKRDDVKGRNVKEKQRMSLTPVISEAPPQTIRTNNAGSMFDVLDNNGWRGQKQADGQPYQRGYEGNPYQRVTAEVMRQDSDATMLSRKYDNVGKLLGSRRELKSLPEALKRVKIENDKLLPNTNPSPPLGRAQESVDYIDRFRSKTVDITILWLALNEECDAMTNPNVQRLYVAFTFLGRSGADLETPNSLPKPKQCVEKCYYNFRKSFQLNDTDLPALGRMARCRTPREAKGAPLAKDCAIFTVVSEPTDDPLGLNNCEDVGYAYLYFGDLLAYSAGSDSYVEVIPVHAAGQDHVCGVLAVKVDGLDVARKCLMLSQTDGNMGRASF